MKRKKLNILIIFFIVFISMFANRKVEAKTYCEYYTYSPIVLNGKILTDFKISTGGSHGGAGTTIDPTDEDDFEYVINDGKTILFQYSDPTFGYNMRFTSPTELTFKSSSFEKEVEKNGCPDFIRIYYDGKINGFEVEKSKSKPYDSFYRGYLSRHGSSSTGFLENTQYFINLKESMKRGFSIYMFRKNFYKENSEYYYKHDIYNELVSQESENATKSKLEACKISYSDGGIDLLYYNSTENDVYDAIVKSEKVYDSDVSTNTLSTAYGNWYKNTSYVMLEYNPQRLLWYFKKIYGNSVEISETQKQNCISFLESAIDLKKSEDQKDKYDDSIPICNYYCKKENAYAEESCRKSDSFDNCKYCYSIPQDTEKTKCLEQYTKQAEKNKEDLEKEIDNKKEKLWENFSSISAPSLDINFDKHYELTCDDVSFFHWFYVVFRILAPVAVIFFGTLDYAKAVIASDVEKMNKSKKNFPKRLILLILFITVPLIISLLLSIFGGDYSLMDCIINGE